MTPTAFQVHLADLGLIRASGEDTQSFLHNLLTHDMLHLAVDQVRHAALCSAKGRMLASFTIWRDGDDFLLLLSADILPAILKKLSMYVLRSKVKLTDASAEYRLTGIVGVASLGPLEAMRAAPLAGGALLRLDSQRCIFAAAGSAPVDALAAIADGSPNDWHLAEIRSGQPRIVAATQELFTPQMVNYELAGVDGVSFQKGCYPGQEVVARTHYLGKVKRRMYRVELQTAFAPGTAVFTHESGDQHCGAIVLTAPAAAGGHEALLVVQSSGAETDSIHVGAADGEKARLLPLPYTVD